MATEQQERKAQKQSAAAGGLLEEIMEHTRLKPEDEGYDVARQGVQALLKELFDRKGAEEQRVDKRLVDQMIDDLDRRLGQQMDEILHHENFQRLESGWRGLLLLVGRIDFVTDIRVIIIISFNVVLYY